MRTVSIFFSEDISEIELYTELNISKSVKKYKEHRELSAYGHLPFKSAQERLLACMYELMPLQFTALDEGLPAFRTNMHSRSVGVEMFPHGSVVSEHLVASLVRTRDGPRSINLDDRKFFSLKTFHEKTLPAYKLRNDQT